MTVPAAADQPTLVAGHTYPDLREAYLHAFDTFATDPVEVADAIPSIGNSRYARELLSLLQMHGLVSQDFVNGDDESWQVVNPGTYDSCSREEAIVVFEQTFRTDDEPATPTKVETVTIKGEVKPRPRPATNPADLPSCTCGCGATLNNRRVRYRPGHDARHAGNVARAIAETGDYSPLANLPTDALQEKASQMAARLLAKSGRTDDADRAADALQAERRNREKRAAESVAAAEQRLAEKAAEAARSQIAAAEAAKVEEARLADKSLTSDPEALEEDLILGTVRIRRGKRRLIATKDATGKVIAYADADDREGWVADDQQAATFVANDEA